MAQSFTNHEIILVDDGSPDGSPAICDEYASYDSKIKVIHKPNGGLSDARNAGLEIATGEYVLFLDSDDWWDDIDTLAKIDKQFRDTNADIVIFGMKKYFAKTKQFGDVRVPKKCDEASVALSHEQVLQKYMQSNIFVACACDKAVRYSLIKNQRFVKGQLSEDIEWCYRLLIDKPSIDVMEEAPYVYRQQVSTSITANVGSKNIKSILDVINKFATFDASTPLLHFLANQYVLLITNWMRLKKPERTLFEKDIKTYWWLLDYNWYPYVKLVSRVKFLGFNVVKSLLKLYYLAKR